MSEANELLTVWMVAQEKGVHVKSVYRAINEGRLAVERTGPTSKTLLVRRIEAEKWCPRRN